MTYWFEKARALIAARKRKRAGLLATQGIRGGANRTVLERILEAGGIFMAWSDREWILDGATVHVSIIGFDNGSQTAHTLDGKTVEQINADLTSEANIDIGECASRKCRTSVSWGHLRRRPFDIAVETARMNACRSAEPEWPSKLRRGVSRCQRESISCRGLGTSGSIDFGDDAR